jgi:hypothetical protein
MKTHTGLAMALALALPELGCAHQPKLMPMRPDQPVEIREGYRQEGERVDPDSLIETLKSEPEAAPAVERAQTLATIATILAGVGGALVGWPLGEASAGAKPHWALAGAGGGAIVVGIPLAIWAGSSMDVAVASHNDLVATRRQERGPQTEPLRPRKLAATRPSEPPEPKLEPEPTPPSNPTEPQGPE